MHIEWVCVCVFERFLFTLFGCNSHPPPVLKTTCIAFDWSGQCLALIVAVPDKRSGKYTCTQSNQNLRGNSTLSSTYTLHTIQDWKLYFGGERKTVKSSSFCKVHWNFNLKNVSLKNPPSQTENHQFSSCPPHFAVFPTISFSLSLIHSKEWSHPIGCNQTSVFFSIFVPYPKSSVIPTQMLE